MDCTSCGKTLDTDALFCSQCGTRVAAYETAPMAQAMPPPFSPAPPAPDRGQPPYEQPGYGVQPGYAPQPYSAAPPTAPPPQNWQQPYVPPAPEQAGMLDGLQMRRWSGDAVHNQPGMQNAQEQIILQTQCQVSNPHMLAVDGNLVLTPSRLTFYKHSLGKWLVMGMFTNLTQGTFVFEYPLEAIARVECSGALAWSYDTLHFTTGETHTFCFNLVNHGRWMNTLRQMLPALFIQEPTNTNFK